MARENGDLVSRKLRQWLSGIPTLAQGVLNQFGWDFEIHQEIGMGAAEPVIRLARRKGQSFFDLVNVEVEEDAAVKKQAMLFATLRVAGELEAADGKVGVALYLDGSFQHRSQCGLVAFENKIVRGGNVVKVAFGAEDQCVV